MPQGRRVNSALDYTHELGGGDKRPIRFVSDGHIVMEIVGGIPSISVPPVDAEPDARPRLGQMFFRDTAVGMQLCVQFPSGNLQILATEPA